MVRFLRIPTSATEPPLLRQGDASGGCGRIPTLHYQVPYGGRHLIPRYGEGMGCLLSQQSVCTRLVAEVFMPTNMCVHAFVRHCYCNQSHTSAAGGFCFFSWCRSGSSSASWTTRGLWATRTGALGESARSRIARSGGFGPLRASVSVGMANPGYGQNFPS